MLGGLILAASMVQSSIGNDTLCARIKRQNCFIYIGALVFLV